MYGLSPTTNSIKALGSTYSRTLLPPELKIFPFCLSPFPRLKTPSGTGDTPVKRHVPSSLLPRTSGLSVGRTNGLWSGARNTRNSKTVSASASGNKLASSSRKFATGLISLMLGVRWVTDTTSLLLVGRYTGLIITLTGSVPTPWWNSVRIRPSLGYTWLDRIS